MTGEGTEARRSGALPDARLLARGLAALRIFFGLILFANGLAKLLEFRSVEVGPWKTFLINREGARNILDFEVNKRGGDGTDVPLLKSIVNDVLLPNWEVFQWLITAVELGAGLALILGLASRLAALVGLGQQMFLQLVYLSSSRWMFEQPHEWVPLVILALVPAGRVWGLDRRLWLRRRRWPF
jgi:thiosulfate dehydrogenase [quinone] large subunit